MGEQKIPQELEYLIEQQKPPKIDYIQQVRLDKDGTYYTIIMMHLPNGIMAQTMAHNKPCWLVVNAINGTTYAFSENGYLATDYLREKLGTGRFTLSQRDIENIKIAIESVRNHYRRTH